MKLTTKLVLGATVVAGLSVSAFAACANNVLMGDKQLKDVANGTDDKDAVNYAQTLKLTTANIPFNADANITSTYAGQGLLFYRIGNECKFYGTFNATDGVASGSKLVAGGLPAGFKLSSGTNFWGWAAKGTQSIQRNIYSSLSIEGAIPAGTGNTYIRVYGTYFCQD